MDRYNEFCREIRELISLKPELFEETPVSAEMLDRIEKEHKIRFPDEFRFFYQIIGNRKVNYPLSKANGLPASSSS